MFVDQSLDNCFFRLSEALLVICVAPLQQSVTQYVGSLKPFCQQLQLPVSLLE
jgi:hypothetical protein